MGQYFIAINKTKKEWVSPWELGRVAKLWEWCVNRTAGIFPLLRKSSGGGGGDIRSAKPSYAGRWAGDEVYLGGDYDDSKLYDIAQSEYKNISRGLVREYNEFIEIAECQLQPRSQRPGSRGEKTWH